MTKTDGDSLVPNDPIVSVIFELWEPLAATSPFPILMPVRHALFEDTGYPIRIFTKDPQQEWKARFRNLMPPWQYKTYSVSKLKDLFESPAIRSDILRETSVFIADRRIGHCLVPILGSVFFSRRRMPVMVDLESDPVDAISTVLRSALINLPRGNTFGVRVGRLSWLGDVVADNACDVIEGVLDKIGCDRMAQIRLRVPDSMALPVWSADVAGLFAGAL